MATPLHSDANMDAMKHSPTRTVTVHARLTAHDAVQLDREADRQMTSRSHLIALIVREWCRKNGKKEVSAARGWNRGERNAIARKDAKP